MNQHNDAEPLQIPGEILSDRDWDTLAPITDEDVQQIPQTWARVVPERYARLIEAEKYDI